jgi:hypothetical protein
VWGGLGKPNRGRDRGETFFPDSGSDRDSDETFQISRNLGLEHIEFVCLLNSQLWLQATLNSSCWYTKVGTFTASSNIYFATDTEAKKQLSVISLVLLRHTNSVSVTSLPLMRQTKIVSVTIPEAVEKLYQLNCYCS